MIWDKWREELTVGESYGMGQGTFSFLSKPCLECLLGATVRQTAQNHTTPRSCEPDLSFSSLEVVPEPRWVMA